MWDMGRNIIYPWLPLVYFKERKRDVKLYKLLCWNYKNQNQNNNPRSCKQIRIQKITDIFLLKIVFTITSFRNRFLAFVRSIPNELSGPNKFSLEQSVVLKNPEVVRYLSEASFSETDPSTLLISIIHSGKLSTISIDSTLLFGVSIVTL